MPKKSARASLIQKSAAELPKASKSDLQRLRAAMRSDVDSTEIPERTNFKRLRRDELGNLPPRRSMIRDAVAEEMQHHNWTVYRLWKLAQQHYPPLSQSAVHEFLKGSRQLELPSIEALLAALNLRLARNGKSKPRRAS